MNAILAIQDYISKMVSSTPGMKCLLLDKETVGIVSMVYTQSQILQKEVYLLERIDVKNRELMAHLKAVCFLRPTAENIKLLSEELQEPKYGEYHLFFSNVLKNSYIQDLAEADVHEVVQEVQEVFADFYAVNSDTFTLNIDGIVSPDQREYSKLLSRTVDGICSILLALKKQPLIRASKNSRMCQNLVSELQSRISQDQSLFDFKKLENPPLLLLLDRIDDPITPLLTQWTYQAMVHDLFGLNNNRVNLKKVVPGVKKDLEEVIISSEQDAFYKSAMYLNFGDLGEKVKALVDEYQSKSHSSQKLESLDDIKHFLEQFPEIKKLSVNVSKHVTLMSELSRVVEERSLLEVSELEQELANNHSHSDHVQLIQSFLRNPKIKQDELLRILMLYSLRYENSSTNELQSLSRELQSLGTDSSKIQLIQVLLKHAGSKSRTGDLFGSKSIFHRGIKTLQRLKGVQNIYTEHKPLLKFTIESLLANKLKEQDYPIVMGTPSRDPPQDIIVFFVGGTTYEEALTVHNFNVANTNTRIILGGTCIHNHQSFLNDLEILRDIYRM